MLQHWMYAQVYLDAAVVTKLYFGARTLEVIKLREMKERQLSVVNGILYVTFLAVLVTDFFMDSDTAQTLLYALLTALMTIFLGYSMYTFNRLLNHFKANKLGLRRKTIVVQIALLGIISIFSLVYFFVKRKFWKDCLDDVEADSWAAIVTRTFQMTNLLLWRIVTVTMCILILHHAR